MAGISAITFGRTQAAHLSKLSDEPSRQIEV
jgi:hypothetical protein